MKPPNKDLFDDSAMSFGEHLEILRSHLIKALIGVTITVLFALFQGGTIIGIIREPLDNALSKYAKDAQVTEALDRVEEFNFWGYIKEQFSTDALENEVEVEPVDEFRDVVTVTTTVGDLAGALNTLDPDTYPMLGEGDGDQVISLQLRAPEFAELRMLAERSRQPVTLNVPEAFLTYLKVSLIAGLILASPWVFYQLWMFVAAGLYRHERSLVYVFGGLSIVLFLAGILFCFYMVFPFVLKFLLGFNELLGVQPQIRLSEWISFAVMLPLMFGVSFQLPLVMWAAEALGIMEADDYREKRRMAVLVIAVLSMFLTPADPMSMLLMMFPLMLLYEFGIQLCRFSPPKTPFEAEGA